MFLIYFLYCWKRRASLLISLWQILQLRFAMSDHQSFILLLPISFTTSALFVNRFGITSTSSAKGYYRLSILWKHFCKTLAITFSFLLKAIPRYKHFSDHLSHTVYVKGSFFQCKFIHVSSGSGFLLS